MNEWMLFFIGQASDQVLNEIPVQICGHGISVLLWTPASPCWANLSTSKQTPSTVQMIPMTPGAPTFRASVTRARIRRLFGGVSFDDVMLATTILVALRKFLHVFLKTWDVCWLNQHYPINVTMFVGFVTFSPSCWLVKSNWTSTKAS